jgi:DNA-3-methyladenine glycosylase
VGKATANNAFPHFLGLPAEQVAERLLGCELERNLDGQTVIVRIVETEAYDEMDEASHTFRGRTPRNEVMFGEPGHLYVYFTYGMHYCCNVVCGPHGHGAAALIRAVEPVEGVELIERRRGMSGRAATNGPAKLCEGLGIDLELNGHDLRTEPLVLRDGGLSDGESVARTRRIGITRAADRIRRYLIAGNPYVSRPA